MNGPDLLRRAQHLLGDECPPALFVSGSPEHIVMTTVPEGSLAGFVSKPWTTAELTQAVMALLMPRGATTSRAA